MVTCASCGAGNPEGQRFCGSCGTPLEPAAATLPEERKVVTALFCDLVGFTSASESADPEDVDAVLTAYFAMARARIEAHGGVVEKFIGDAVVAVFGIPAAHEDDPERAVRAGLRIVEDAEAVTGVGGAPLRLRVGINTGEALVRLGVAPGSGEGFLTGDSVNTASRIESVAPEMGVAVGLATYEATRATFDYEELPPASLKGKAKPVRVFHARAPRARLGVDLTRTHDSVFVGREIDLALLRGLFDKSVAARSVQLVTVVGEPGLGKSRIVAELRGYVDERPELVAWRQGRCLPYGEGISFWALGEILKAHAGILETDALDVATTKLDAVLPDDAERPWFRQRLLPLLGIEAGSTAEREEQFTAWRRFLEHVAEAAPTVLVFEDLHWADEAMLAFLEHLADRAEGIPLLVVGTARPELYERHPSFAAGLRNANRVNLDPLTAEETARLVASRLETTSLPAAIVGPVLERAEGNPLYAEEFVRLLLDRDLLERTPDGWRLAANAEVPLPDSIGALIAARLDTLPADRKSMLADAAVIGKVFWAGAVAAMGNRDPHEVTEALRDLARKELVRPARQSSMGGEAEYAFWHVLARDVAYAQLPRASRAARHVAAARWIESMAPTRVEDLADVLAHHYATALELARAVGRPEQARELEVPALRYLTLAGERALGLDTARALASFERALALVPEDHPDRTRALAGFGVAASHVGRYVDAATALEAAAGAFRARGDLVAAADAMGDLVLPLARLGDARAWTLPGETLELLEPLGPSPGLVRALTEMAVSETLRGRLDEGLATADRALALADALHLARPARAIGFRGLCRAGMGDPGGLDDLRAAIELAIAAGAGREVTAHQNNLAVSLWSFEGPASTLATLTEGTDYASGRGLTDMSLSMRCGSLDAMVDLGRLDEVLAESEALAALLQDTGDQFNLATHRTTRARVLVIRGQADEAASWLPAFEAAIRDVGGADVTASLAWVAALRFSLGQADHAQALLEELARTPEVRASPNYFAYLPAMIRTAMGIGDLDLARRLSTGVVPPHPLAAHALVTANAALTEARGDFEAASLAYAEAADRWRQFGVVPEQAFALLGQGRSLVAVGRPAEPAIPLEQARAIFERLGAGPPLAETVTLLGQSSDRTARAQGPAG